MEIWFFGRMSGMTVKSSGHIEHVLNVLGEISSFIIAKIFMGSPLASLFETASNTAWISIIKSINSKVLANQFQNSPHLLFPVFMLYWIFPQFFPY